MPPVLAFALLALSSSAADEPITPTSLSISSVKQLNEPRRFLPERGVRLPVVDYSGPTGAPERERGIVAGISLAPNTTLGVGFFNSRRAKSGLAPDPQLDRTRRSSKKAAIGISLKF